MKVANVIEHARVVLLATAIFTIVIPAVATAQILEAQPIDGFPAGVQPLFVDIDRGLGMHNLVMGDDDVRDAPKTLVGYRSPENLGKSFDFRVTGAATGTIWGTDIYTDDSNLATAAVHAGVVQPGETQVVRVTILPGRSSYRGGERSDISSSSYGRWYGSYVLDSVDESAPVAEIVAVPKNLSGVEGEIGQSFLYPVTGAVEGYVWGADVYTDDSSLAAAAVHAGAVEAGQTAVIKVTILPGRSYYNGSERHGVSTKTYGSYSRSYMIDREVGVQSEPRQSTF
jgi:hypothetical protein